jgi:hypothetical protein
MVIPSNSFRSGVYLELQRFQNLEKGRGLALNLAELRALTALTILLDKTDFKGNRDGKPIGRRPWKHLGNSPAVSFTWREYLKAYYGGNGNGSAPHGNQIEIAKRAFYSLCNKNSLEISYYRGHNKNVVKDTNSLIHLLEYRGNKRITKLAILYHPIFIDRIDTFFVLKPIQLYNNIQIALTKHRFSKPIMLFIEWILTKNKTPYLISEKLLIERLWLDNLVNIRHKDRMRNILMECYKAATTLGYIDNIVMNGGDQLEIHINPTHCSRQ